MSKKLKKISDWLLDDDSDEEMTFEYDSVEMMVAIFALFISLIALFTGYSTLSVILGLGAITIIYISLKEVHTEDEDSLNDE